jgi:hypothetical protein
VATSGGTRSRLAARGHGWPWAATAGGARPRYSRGNYGDIDTEYRTETDSFARIVSTGPSTLDGKGPERFLVYTKDGRIRTYTAQIGLRYQQGTGFSDGNP